MLLNFNVLIGNVKQQNYLGIEQELKSLPLVSPTLETDFTTQGFLWPLQTSFLTKTNTKVVHNSLSQGLKCHHSKKDFNS